MSRKDALQDTPGSSFVGKPGKPSGAGLKPKDDPRTPAGNRPEPPSGSVKWRTARPGQEEQ
jgi:hypothetical protein